LWINILSKGNLSSSTLSVRDAKHVLSWKIIEYLGLISFLIVLPREMGPEQYGKFAALFSLVNLLWLTSALGAQAAYGRFIPEFNIQSEKDRTRILFTQFFLLRSLLAVVLVFIFLTIIRRLMPDLSSETLWIAGALFFAGAVSMSFFQLFYGLNQLGRWLLRDNSSRLLLVLLLLVLGVEFSLVNVFTLMLFIEVCFLSIGLHWSRSYFLFNRHMLDLSSFYVYLKFGVQFFIANLLLFVIWRSGEIIVLGFSQQSEEVAYYNIANAIALTIYGLFTQLGVMMVPSLSTLHDLGEHEKKSLWMANILKYTTICTWLTLIILKAVSEPLLVLILGGEFLPVIENLLILTLALFPMHIIRLGVSTALVHKQLNANILVAVTALTTFVIASLLITPEFGAIGTSSAVVLGAVCGALVAYRIFSLADIIALARFWPLTIVGCISLLLSYIPFYPDLVGGGLSLFIFMVSVLILKIIRLDEIRWIIRGIGKAFS
jgi:O-antigen/teichoic acid export membrane protein